MLPDNWRPGLTGQVSLEAPETQYTSAAGVFTPDSSVTGSPSPAFNAAPDLLGRLTYRDNGLVLDMRGLLRQLSIRTAGTAAAPPALTRNAAGWGVAAHARVPMRWLSDVFGPDELLGMVYYGQGIGRYFAGNTSGQDALSNIGLPGSSLSFSLNPLPTYGAIVAYRHFWTAATSHQHLLCLFARRLPILCTRLHTRFAIGPGSEPRHAASVRQSDMEPVRDGSRWDVRQRLGRCRSGIRLHAARPVRRFGGGGLNRFRAGRRQSLPGSSSRAVLSMHGRVGKGVRGQLPSGRVSKG